MKIFVYKLNEKPDLKAFSILLRRFSSFSLFESLTT